MSEDASLREGITIPFYSKLNAEEIGLLDDTPQKVLPVIIETAETIARIFANMELYEKIDMTQDIYFELSFEGGDPERIQYFIKKYKRSIKKSFATCL